MSIQTLSDKSLKMQLRVVNGVNGFKQSIADALFRREEGMEMVQAALLVAAALVAAVFLFDLFEKVGQVFQDANTELGKYQ